MTAATETTATDRTGEPLPAEVDIAVIGAGFSGVGTAIRLLQDGHTDFAVLERGDDVGGTCWFNTYPGCQCDIPSHLYSYSFAPNPASKVTPDYTIGCKRILPSNRWYPALSEPNVELVSSGVTEVREHSVVDADGVERKVDTIIFGTGFHVTDMPIGSRVRGRGGKTLVRRRTRSLARGGHFDGSELARDFSTPARA